MLATLLPIDAIREFPDAAKSKAEYGFKTGSITNIGFEVRHQQPSRHRQRFWPAPMSRCEESILPDGQKAKVSNLKQFGALVGRADPQGTRCFFTRDMKGQRYEIGNPAAGITYPTLSNAASVGKCLMATSPVWCRHALTIRQRPNVESYQA